MKKHLCILLFLLTAFMARGQTDTVALEAAPDEYSYADSLDFDQEQYKDAEDVQGAADSTQIRHRYFNEDTLDKLASDPSLQYKQPPTIAESLWERFLLWLSQLIDSLFSSAMHTNWGRVFAWIVGIVVLVVVIMMIFRVNAFRIFYSGEGASTIKYNVFDENIHEIDFDKEINDAVAQKDYRKGVRLVFLYALKTLSDKQLIQWEQGKTNHDYVAELKSGDVKVGLNELSFYFDYAWYGNFTVTQDLFDKVNRIFRDFKGKV